MFKDLALLSQVKGWLLSREKGLVMVVLVVVMVVLAYVLVEMAVVVEVVKEYAEEVKVAAAKGGNSSRRLCKIYRLSASPCLYLLLGEIA